MSPSGNTKWKDRHIARPPFTHNEYETVKALAGDEPINRYIRRLIMEDAEKRGVEFVEELPGHGGAGIK